MIQAPDDAQGFHAFKRAADPATFPQDFSDYLRSFGEIYWWPKGNFHVITRKDHATEILKSKAFSADRRPFFLTRMPNLDLSLVQDFFGVVSKMMVMSDDEDHTRRRKAASIGFEDHVIDAFEAEVKETVEELTRAAYKASEFDFVDAIAKHLPCTVLANLFSIPEADRREYFEWSNTMTGFFGGGSGYENADGIRVNKAAVSLREYFKELIRERRASPGKDYVSLLLKGQERFGLEDDEVISQATMMLVAGQVTTTDQVCNNLYQILATPGAQEVVRSDPSRVAPAMEEATRFDPAVTFLFRVCREDTEIGGQPIAKGQTVFLSTHCINRHQVEPTPDLFDVHRANPKHFGYGNGPHYCIGAKLGRMEMLNLFETMFQKFPALELGDPEGFERDHYSLSFSGFKTFPLRVQAQG